MLSQSLLAVSLPFMATLGVLKEVRGSDDALFGFFQPESTSELEKGFTQGLLPKVRSFIKDSINIFFTALITGDSQEIKRKIDVLSKQFKITLVDKAKDIYNIEMNFVKAVAIGGAFTLLLLLLAQVIAGPLAIVLGIFSLPILILLVKRFLLKGFALRELRQLKKVLYAQSSSGTPDFVIQAVLNKLGVKNTDKFLTDLMEQDVSSVWNKYDFDNRISPSYVLSNFKDTLKSLDSNNNLSKTREKKTAPIDIKI